MSLSFMVVSKFDFLPFIVLVCVLLVRELEYNVSKKIKMTKLAHRIKTQLKEN